MSAPQTEPIHVLLVEDDEGFLLALRTIFTRAGIQVTAVSSAAQAESHFSDMSIDVALFDVHLKDASGIDLLNRIKARRDDLEVLVMTGQGTVDMAVEALKNGALEFLSKPFASIEAVVHTVRATGDRRRILRRSRELELQVSRDRFGSEVLGMSPAMEQPFRMMAAAAATRSSVLITGETGTGKEVLARAIHLASDRKTFPFVAVNCGALTETLLESELFGHVKGAFTGAVSNRKGVFEMANQGTIFLDELGEMPIATQVRLLRVLQELEVRPVGGTQNIPVDVRVIAATHVDLEKAMEQNRFRQDLYFRIKVVQIELPPLRARPTDIPLLAQTLLERAAVRLNKKVTRLGNDALKVMISYRWPGNVRELQNVIERAVVLSRTEEISAEDLPSNMSGQRGSSEQALDSIVELPYAQAKRLAVGEFERRYLTTLLRVTDGNVAAAAVRAGLDRSNLRRLLRQYDIRRPDAEEGRPDDFEAGA